MCLSLHRDRIEKIERLDNNLLFQNPIQSASLLQTMVTRWWKVTFWKLNAVCTTVVIGLPSLTWKQGLIPSARRTSPSVTHLVTTWLYRSYGSLPQMITVPCSPSKPFSSHWITQETMRRISRIMITSGTLVLWMYSVSIMISNIAERARVGAQIVLHQ